LRLAARGISFVFNASARAETVELKTVDEGLAELRRYAATNLRTIRARHPEQPAPFWADRLDSSSLRDRLMRLVLNPFSDLIVDVAIPIVPFSIQRRLLNYKVMREVSRGYREGAA
jgi:hypothetical protein